VKRFIVYSGIPKNEIDVPACMMGTSEVLKNAGIKDVHLKTCYCCSPPDMKKVITEFEAPTKEILSVALQKIEFPVDSITEVTKLELKKA
jgi:hypothetical protein